MSGPFVCRLSGEFVSLIPSPTGASDGANDLLEHDRLGFWLRTAPVRCAQELSARLKHAAKLIGCVTGQQRGHALETLAQALGFASWHDLSQHLARASGFQRDGAPGPWAKRLALAAVLLVKTPPAVRVPSEVVSAYERLASALAMLTDMQPQRFLDDVCARLCSDGQWLAVRERTPLRAAEPLYRFEVDADGPRGRFVRSPACHDLIEQLDERVVDHLDQVIEDFRPARPWIEAALAAQPGFLEAGLQLAWLQHEEGEAEAGATLDRFIRQAEALVPTGYDGGLAWGFLDNRPYHRMLWLRMKIHHERWELRKATALARKLLALNLNDNVGARYVLPLLLLQAGHAAAAQRETRRFRDELDRQCAAIRAFCAYAQGDMRGFRRELARALFTLPALRLILLNQTGPLPDGENGFRGVQPDLETFVSFGWPACHCVPGLLASCAAFLAEPAVLEAEDELRRAWRGFGRAGLPGVGTHEGWIALTDRWVNRLADGGLAR